MRTVLYQSIVEAVRNLCIKGTSELPPDVAVALHEAAQSEQSPQGKSVLNACLQNAVIAAAEQAPLCQDTGFAVFFVELGCEVRIEGGTFNDAITEGTRRGYGEGFLRASIVADPLFDRKNSKDNTPPIIHLALVAGDKLEIVFAPKGGGAENMSHIAMLKPSDGEEAVKRFVVDTVIAAGANPCPPVVVGVGIGGTFEYCALLSKRALLRTIGERHPDPRYAALESAILKSINESGIGPQGLGGSTTALAVHIESYPCHIASLPVAVNLNCHVARHVSVRL